MESVQRGQFLCSASTTVTSTESTSPTFSATTSPTESETSTPTSTGSTTKTTTSSPTSTRTTTPTTTLTTTTPTNSQTTTPTTTTTPSITPTSVVSSSMSTSKSSSITAKGSTSTIVTTTGQLLSSVSSSTTHPLTSATTTIAMSETDTPVSSSSAVETSSDLTVVSTVSPQQSSIPDSTVSTTQATSSLQCSVLPTFGYLVFDFSRGDLLPIEEQFLAMASVTQTRNVSENTAIIAENCFDTMYGSFIVQLFSAPVDARTSGEAALQLIEDARADVIVAIESQALKPAGVLPLYFSASVPSSTTTTQTISTSTTSTTLFIEDSNKESVRADDIREFGLIVGITVAVLLILAVMVAVAMSWKAQQEAKEHENLGKITPLTPITPTHEDASYLDVQSKLNYGVPYSVNNETNVPAVPQPVASSGKGHNDLQREVDNWMRPMFNASMKSTKSARSGPSPDYLENLEIHPSPTGILEEGYMGFSSGEEAVEKREHYYPPVSSLATNQIGM
eukprot:m.58201 g.58201  ORF g.58201 m.58201 type:complete len:507 (-) comp11161_c0_seq1:20-1540(-)